MLSIFPTLLVFGIFAPFVLRVVVGTYLFYIGYAHMREGRELLTQELSGLFGSFSKYLVIIGGLFEAVIGLSLIAGFLTQVMALLGALYMVKLLIFKNNYPVWIKHERVFYVILLAIFLSLLLSGAGVPAIDLPL